MQQWAWAVSSLVSYNGSLSEPELYLRCFWSSGSAQVRVRESLLVEQRTDATSANPVVYACLGTLIGLGSFRGVQFSLHSMPQPV